MVLTKKNCRELAFAFLLAILCSLATSMKTKPIENERETTQHPPLDPSKTCYLKRADQFYVAAQSALNLHNKLPLGWYTVGWNQMMSEYYLKQIFPFDLRGKKLYGDTTMQAERILKTFQARAGKTTGVLLAGQKGSGKTLLAKHISVRAAEELGVSTIVINEPWSGERFNAFIQSIQQPTIVLFDEFEKVYRQSAASEATEHDKRLERRMRYGDHEEFMPGEDRISNPSQDAILTLLDGVYPSNMLFLFTVNDKSKISENMMNRPGRIYYVLDFSGLESNFIHDCKCINALVDTMQAQCVSNLFTQIVWIPCKTKATFRVSYPMPPCSMRSLSTCSKPS